MHLHLFYCLVFLLSKICLKTTKTPHGIVWCLTIVENFILPLRGILKFSFISRTFGSLYDLFFLLGNFFYFSTLPNFSSCSTAFSVTNIKVDGKCCSDSQETYYCRGDRSCSSCRCCTRLLCGHKDCKHCYLPLLSTHNNYLPYPGYDTSHLHFLPYSLM